MLSCYQSSIIAHELHLRLLDVGCRDEVTIADDRQLIACDCASPSSRLQTLPFYRPLTRHAPHVQPASTAV